MTTRSAPTQTTRLVRSIMREFNVESHNIWTNTYRTCKTIKCFATIYDAHAIKRQCEKFNLKCKIDMVSNNIKFSRCADMFGVTVNI